MECGPLELKHCDARATSKPLILLGRTQQECKVTLQTAFTVVCIGLAACSPSRTTYDVHALTPVVDGRGDDWASITPIDGFTLSSGKAPSRLHTTARVAHDAVNLYALFTCDDPDMRATMLTHDQPIYREETVEMFIEPVSGSGSYVELQSSPRGVTFDAAFTGGARKNMNKGFDADFEAVCAVDGTIDDPSDVDRGWVCEWRIGLASLPNLTLPLKNGDSWRANLFRVAKDAVSPADPTIRRDESTWSPPMQGDFHVLERFGVFIFRGS